MTPKPLGDQSRERKRAVSGLRPGLRPQGLIRALIGAACVSTGLALLAGIGPFGASLAATAVQSVSGAGSLIVLALLDWDVRKHHPGITSLLRRYSCAAVAGSLLPIVASQRFFAELGAVPALAAALAGLALTLLSALLLVWLLRNVRLDGPLPSESLAVARLAALSEVLARSTATRESGDRRFANTPAPRLLTRAVRSRMFLSWLGLCLVSARSQALAGGVIVCTALMPAVVCGARAYRGGHPLMLSTVYGWRPQSASR